MASVDTSPRPLAAASPGEDGCQDSRRRLFRETPAETAMRWLLGTAYSLQPKRAADVPFLLWHMARDLIHGGTRVPDPARTRARPDSFGGVCRDISPETILAAARLGYFPWCHFGPLKWWTRSRRMLLVPADFRIAKHARRLMRKNVHRVTFDRAFAEVMRACAGRRRNRPGLTWITPQIMRLYARLHDMGHAHSFEVWNAAGELVGGGYGLAIGRVFITESMFSLESNASKIGFAALNYHLARWGYVVNDGKDWAPTLEEAGMQLVTRAEYERVLAEHAHAGGRTAPWAVEADLATIAA